ncbi:MAG: metal ABC transporter solute-binding protein, Zn/Mn family [Candidatus Poseidoniaceae archaeon]
MTLQTSKPLLLALMLITSSLAGCLGTGDDTEDGLGTVMVSTYHVQQLAEAVGGDLVDVQLLSPSNIPVHDYEPTPSDIVTLGTADLFFYHGLGLETWVDATLDSMGSSAPKAVSTHAMPDGDIALEFEAILIADLCEHLNEGPYEAMNLTAEEDEHEEHEEDHHVVVVHYPDNTSVSLEVEDHADWPENATGWNLTTTALTANNITWNATLGSWGHMVNGIGGVDADASWYWALLVWDEAGDHWETSQVGIDSVMLNETEHIAWAPSYVNHTMIAEPHHDEDEHDEHDHHEGHEHHTAEETIDSPAACPADTMIHIYGLEEGEHVLEFEATGIDTFDLVVLKMGGAHAHHHHDHGDDDHDDHGDEGPEIHAEHVAHRLSFPEHDDHDDHGDDDHDHNESDDDHGDETHVEHGMITLHVEAEGDYGFALPHDVTMHVLKGEGHDDHDDHDDHGDDDHDDHGDDHDDHGDDHDDHDDDHDDHGDDHDDHGDEEARFDPHSWLDPLAFRAQVKVVRDAMIEAFPEGEDTFTANAEAYMAELVELDQGFASLSDCSLNEIAANHDAYTYMAERYDLEFVTVHGLDPEGEPSAADIEKVVDRINDKELTVFFIEEYTNEDAVASLIEETDGVTVMTLYTMEMAPKTSGDNYLTLMQKNLDNLKSGLAC